MYNGHRSQVTGHRSQVTGHRSQVTGHRGFLTFSKPFALLALLLALVPLGVLAAPGWADVAVTKVLLNRKSKTLIVGQTLQLAATVYPDKATNKAVTWSTSNVSIAVVDNNGLVTARGAGKATITVTATNGTETADDDKTATCVVTVKTADTVETTVDVGDADTLKRALADAGIDVINITENITLDGFEIPRSVTIDLNGHTLTAITILVADGDLTVRNGGQLISSLCNEWEGTLTLEGVEVTANPYHSSTDHDNYEGGALWWNGVIVLRNSRMTVNAGPLDSTTPNMWGVPADGKMLDLDDTSWLKIGTVDTSQAQGFDGMWLLLGSLARGYEGKDDETLTKDYQDILGDFFPDGHTLYAFGGEGVYLFVKPGEGQEAPTSITLKKKVMTSPTAKTGLIYNGKPQALLDEAGAANFGTMVYKLDSSAYSTDIPVGTDAKKYTVWYLVSGDAGYSNSEPQSLDVAIDRAAPAAGDFDVTLPADLTYNGQAKTASVSVKSGVSGMGTPAVEYYSGGAKIDSAVIVGTYTVKLNVPEGDNYSAATLTDASWTFSIAKATPGYDKPTGLTATYGDTLASVKLPDGWAWAVAETTSVGNAGTNTFKAAFTPSDMDNYNTVDNVDVTVTVNKAEPEYTLPTGLTATYGDTLASVKLPEGWAWANSSQSVGTVGTRTFKANYTPSDTDNYNTVDNVDVSVTVREAAPDDSGTPDKPSDELTEEQRAAQDEAEKKQAQDTAEKAEKAGEAAKTVDTSTESGQALADMLSGTAQGSTKEQQAAALEVKEELEKSGLDVSDLTADEVKAAVENKAQERKDAVYEASGQVEKTTVPAATDLLENYSSNEDLQAANKELTVQPKVVEPEVLNETSRDQAVQNIEAAARGEQEVAEGVDSGAVQAADQQGLLTSKDITIEPASKDLKAQTEAVEKVFILLSADLAGAANSTGGKGVVIVTVFPKMTPKASGFFPLRVNLRNLLPGRRLKFWPSVSHFKRQAQGEAAVAGVELAAAGEEGQYFFLDENGVPTAVVSGDASKMTAVPFLTAGKEYSDAFITADATEADQAALDTLAEKAGGSNSDAPTSNKGSGGCDAGLGLAGLLALIGLIAARKH